MTDNYWRIFHSFFFLYAHRRVQREIVVLNLQIDNDFRRGWKLVGCESINELKDFVLH